MSIQEALDLTHYSVAKLVKYLLNETAAYCPIKRKFYQYDEKIGLWKQNNQYPQQFMCDYVVDYVLTQRELFPLSYHEDFSKLKLKLSSYTFQSHVARMLQYMLYDNKFRSKLDTCLEIPCKNGMVNPQTGELRERRRSDYCTFCLDVDYCPETSTSNLDSLCSSEYFQRVLGSGMYGTGSSVYMVLVGDSAVKFLNVLKRSVRELISRNIRGTPPFHEVGTRFLICSDVEEKIKPLLLKTLLEKRKVVVKLFRQKPLEYSPRMLCITVANKIPSKIDPRARYFKIDNWNSTPSNEEVLNWLVQCAKKYNNYGLTDEGDYQIPQIKTKKTEEQKGEELLEFLRDNYSYTGKDGDRVVRKQVAEHANSVLEERITSQKITVAMKSCFEISASRPIIDGRAQWGYKGVTKNTKPK